MKILSINESFNFQSMVAYAYLIILPLAIRISGQIYLQDIFVPIMGLFCLFIIWKNPSEIIELKTIIEEEYQKVDKESTSQPTPTVENKPRKVKQKEDKF